MLTASNSIPVNARKDDRTLLFRSQTINLSFEVRSIYRIAMKIKPNANQFKLKMNSTITTDNNRMIFILRFTCRN